jgi:hypothetical protein
MNHLKKHLTYSNVIATAALFLALGGGAIAAFKAPKNSVSTKALKNKAVKEAKIADGAVTSGKLADNAVTNPKLAADAVTDAKVANGTLTAGKIAGAQVFKNIVIKESIVANTATNSFNTKDIQCDSGQAIGGGVTGTTVGTRNFPNLDIDTEPLTFGPIDANGSASAGGTIPTGWHMSAHTITGPRDLHFYVVCAQR